MNTAALSRQLKNPQPDWSPVFLLPAEVGGGDLGVRCQTVGVFVETGQHLLAQVHSCERPALVLEVLVGGVEPHVTGRCALAAGERHSGACKTSQPCHCKIPFAIKAIFAP